jgi:hypothetical protein
MNDPINEAYKKATSQMLKMKTKKHNKDVCELCGADRNVKTCKKCETKYCDACEKSGKRCPDCGAKN